MVSNDLKLFNLLDILTNKKFKKFSELYKNDTKKFLNKISRDYKDSKKFPAHILKQIKAINKNDYDSAICILRGALPYSILFEANGWKVHYVVCGRRNEKHAKNESDLRFNKSVDKTISRIKGKKVLLIENNSLTGNTPGRVAHELKKSFNIKKPDLFLDYFVPKQSWTKHVSRFEDNEQKKKMFGKIFIASELKPTKAERNKLVNHFLEKLNNLNSK